MSDNPRFIMLGGFLGAGKTTTISRLAGHYQHQGKRVAIVTNDQASDLVDTHLLRSQGYDVGEVAGSCFCCNFNELTGTVERLSADERPDVVIAEPVGSCTDLVATVIRPLQQIYVQPFDIAPYGVLLKPSHGLKILRGVGQGGFSPQAEYIFRKQIEEADFVVVNRIDELRGETIGELIALLEENYRNIPCLRMSAKTGEGFDEFCDFIDRDGEFGKRLMDVDYDVYAEGEAELGWLNAQMALHSSNAFELDAFLMTLVERLRDQLNANDAEVAHLKIIGMSNGSYAVANLIHRSSEPTLSIGSNSRINEAEMVVNARVAIDPDKLSQLIQEVLQKVASGYGVELTIRTLQSFRPGRPVPTHRLVS